MLGTWSLFLFFFLRTGSYVSQACLKLDVQPGMVEFLILYLPVYAVLSIEARTSASNALGELHPQPLLFFLSLKDRHWDQHLPHFFPASGNSLYCLFLCIYVRLCLQMRSRVLLCLAYFTLYNAYQARPCWYAWQGFLLFTAE